MRFKQPPIAVDGLSVRLATHIFARVVVYPIMEIVIAGQSPIRLMPVGVERAAGYDDVADERHEGTAPCVGNEPHPHLRGARRTLRHPENALFAGAAAPLGSLAADMNRFVFPRAAHVGFVSFTDASEKRGHISGHDAAHQKDRLVGGSVRATAFILYRLNGPFTEERINEPEPVTAMKVEVENGVDTVGRPFSATATAPAVMTAEEPRMDVPAARAGVQMRHRIGGKS